MPIKSPFLVLLSTMLLFSCVSCPRSDKGPVAPTTPKTSQITGTVNRSGVPATAEEVKLKLYPKGTAPKPHDIVPVALTQAEGKFAFSSFKAGDGAQDDV